MTAQQALQETRRRGITLTPAGATLRFYGPRGALCGELRDHVETEHVGLAFLENRRAVFHRLAYVALAVDRLLDTQPVCDLMEHRVPEERVERDLFALVLGNQNTRDR